jgi:hypothetical protein
VSKDAPQQDTLFESQVPGDAGVGDGVAVSRRKHVVPQKRSFAPMAPVAKRESAGAKLRRVVNLRVPVVMLGAGLTVLVMVVGMVYLLGMYRGMKQGREKTILQIRESQGFYKAASDLNAAEWSPNNLSWAPEAKPVPWVGEKPAATGEKRKAGLNYLVLAMYPKADAERLVEFLKGRGVEAQAINGHNGALYRVVALRGFDAQGLRSKEYQAYRQQILLLGREWNTRNKGPTNLSDVWPQRYDG